MSHVAKTKRNTINLFRQSKAENKKITMVTCYDAAFARLIDDAEIDVVLVGDSLGNVVLGYENTIPVTIDAMVHHTAAVRRGLERAYLIADMPFLSYQTKESALANAGRLMQEAGAQAIKLEGGEEIAETITQLVQAGIPVMGHVGLKPQSIHVTGGYKIQGRDQDAAEKMRSDVFALQEAGCFSVVFEMVQAALATELSQQLQIPTVGIGSGPGCDGQVLVLYDLLGMDRDFNPRFLKKYANLADTVKDALLAYKRDVENVAFPAETNSF